MNKSFFRIERCLRKEYERCEPFLLKKILKKRNFWNKWTLSFSNFISTSQLIVRSLQSHEAKWFGRRIRRIRIYLWTGEGNRIIEQEFLMIRVPMSQRYFFLFLMIRVAMSQRYFFLFLMIRVATRLKKIFQNF